MLFKKKSLPKAQNKAVNKATDDANRMSVPAETKNNVQIRKVSDREIALCYMLW